MPDTPIILELRFSGGGVKPTAVRASEVAELISSFEKILVTTLIDKQPDIDVEKYAYLSFSEIRGDSLDLKFITDRAREAFITAYLLLTTSIAQNTFNELPYPALQNLKIISKFSRKHNCNCDYIYENESIATLKPDTVIEISNSNLIKGETTIYGKIERVGGAEPRIVFKDHSNNKIYFEVSQPIAKQLATRLYDDIALTGTATWDKKTYRIIDFAVTDITDLEQKSLVETFSEIHNVIQDKWIDFEDTD